MTGNITMPALGTVDGRDLSVDGAKLDGIEAGADVTDTTNVTAAGALMDSEVVNLAAVKAFDSADYATAAQGTLADSAVQLNDSPTFGSVTVTGTVDGRDVSVDGTKLDTIETGADVTDVTNVTAAGALMDSEVSANLKTFTLPATTTISTFGASLVDDADAAAARTTLGLGSAATTASTDYATAAQGATADTAVQPASTNTLTNKTITNVVLDGSVTEEVFAVTGTTPALDPINGTIQTWTLTAASTPTDSFAAGESFTLMIDDGAAYTITWPTMTWVNNGAVAPTLATTGYTVVALWKVSTTLYGALVGDGS
jgi:hypothetical protein